MSLSTTESPSGRKPKYFRALSGDGLGAKACDNLDTAVSEFVAKYGKRPDYVRMSTAKDGVWYTCFPGESDVLTDRWGRKAGEVWAVRYA